MSFRVRPHPWWTPIGLLAVIGPSMKLNGSPPRLRSRSVSKVRSRSHRSSTRCSSPIWSGCLGTGSNGGIRGVYSAGPRRPSRSGQGADPGSPREADAGVRSVKLVLVAEVVEGGVLGQVARQLGKPELEPLREPPLVDLHMLVVQLVHDRFLRARGPADAFSASGTELLSPAALTVR